MKKLKVVISVTIIVVLLAILIGITCNILSSKKNNTSNVEAENIIYVSVNYVPNVTIKLQQLDNFYGLSYEEQNNIMTNEENMRCIYCPINEDFKLSIYLEECERNIEGYTPSQYLENYLGTLGESDIVDTGKIENQNDCDIQKATRTDIKDERAEVYTYYCVNYKNRVFIFNAYFINKDLYNEHISKIDTIMRSLKIEDNAEKNIEINPNNINDNKFYYSMLSDEDKKIYDEIVNTFYPEGRFLSDKTITYPFTHKNNKEFSDTLDRYNNIEMCIKQDIGLAASGYISFYVDYTKKEFVFKNWDESVLDKEKQQYYELEKIANNIVSKMPSNLTKYGKYKYLANELSKIVEYDYSLKKQYNGDIIGAFINHSVVCLGYTRAYEYLCKKAGLFCYDIAGGDEEAKSAPHIWNVIEINGDFYYLDVTWLDCNDKDSQEAFNIEQARSNGHSQYLEDLTKQETLATKYFLKTGTVDWMKSKEKLSNK